MGEEEIGELFGKDWPALKDIYLSIWREMQIKIKLEMEGCRSSFTEPPVNYKFLD